MNILKKRHFFIFLIIFLALLLEILAYTRISLIPTITPAEIKSIKMIGGLHTNPTILLPGKDDESIVKLSQMVNHGINLGKANEKDVGYIYSEARPLGILFEKRNGDQIIIWTFYQPNAASNGGIGSRDKVILSKVKNGVDHFYVIESKELVDFLMYDFREVFTLQHRVNDLV